MKELSIFIDKNYDYFMQYNRIVVYYDNGQIELSNTLNSSEKKFFYKPQELKKSFIKSINKKYFAN